MKLVFKCMISHSGMKVKKETEIQKMFLEVIEKF